MKNATTYFSCIVLGVLMLMLTSRKAHAQDPQISQYDQAPIMFNPANTGMLKYTDMRIAALYRSQWSSLSTSFNTFAGSFDMAVNDRMGLGAVFVSTDEANVISTSSFLVSGGYQITDPNQRKYMITTGVQLGVIFKRVNTSEMIFDNQYNQTYFDGALPSGEDFTRTSRVMLDANIGFSYKSTDRRKKINPFVDAAVHHITMPNESFIGEDESKLPMRWMANVGARIEVNRQFIVDPSVTYFRQREAEQFLINAIGNYEVTGTPYQVILGLGYRTQDAAIVTAGIRHNANIFRISYDINTSPLSEYSNNRGALEFTVIYRPGRRTSRAIY